MNIKSIKPVSGEFEIEAIPPGTSVDVCGITLKNENETSMPDIDYDVSESDKVREHLFNLWGDECVAFISNFSTLQLRALIKDLSKLYNIPFTEVNAVTNVMLKEATPAIKVERGIKAGVLDPPATFEEIERHSESLKGFFTKYPFIRGFITNLLGHVRAVSQHAGGVLIAKELSKNMPLIRSKGKQQTPWPEGQRTRELEPLGFIKFDILGLETLAMFENAIKFILQRYYNNPNPTFDDIKEFYNKELHPDVINFNDLNVYREVFELGHFAGIFQFAEKGIQRFAKNVKPCTLDEITAISATWRPGPLAIRADKLFTELKQDPSQASYIHPVVKDVLGKNYGLILYQEDLAWLAHKIGKDVPLTEGNLLRKVLTKKGTGKGHEVKDAIKVKFLAGAKEKGIDDKDAEELWGKMEYFSQYGFNRSVLFSELITTYDKNGTKIEDKRIKDFVGGEYVRSRDEKINKDILVRVKQNHYHGKLKVFEVMLENGEKVRCSMNHKFRTTTGQMLPLWKILKDNLEIVVSVEKSLKLLPDFKNTKKSVLKKRKIKKNGKNINKEKEK